MDDKERSTLKEHIVWLGSQLEYQRQINKANTEFLKRLVHPEDFGFSVSNEVRQIAYALLINNQTEK
jgi:hypothetical protein